MPTLSGGIVSWFRLKACPKCRGDLASDEGDWICLQCGTYYYTGLYGYTGLSIANPPGHGPEAESQPEGQMNSQGERGQTDQGNRNAPDYPPSRQEKALVWPLGATFTMAVAAPRVVAATANLISSVDLSIRQQ